MELLLLLALGIPCALGCTAAWAAYAVGSNDAGNNYDAGNAVTCNAASAYGNASRNAARNEAGTLCAAEMLLMLVVVLLMLVNYAWTGFCHYFVLPLLGILLLTDLGTEARNNNSDDVGNAAPSAYGNAFGSDAYWNDPLIILCCLCWEAL